MKLKRKLAAFAAAAVTLSAFPAAAFADDKEDTVFVAVLNDTFSKEEGAAWDGILLAVEVPINEDTTMFSAITEAIESSGYTISAPDSGWGPFISDINGVGETTYAVKEGYYPGWNVALNQWFTNQGVSAYTVKDGSLADGDVITLEYAVTGDDIGNSWASNDTSLSEVYLGIEPFADFKPDVFEYTLTLDSNELDLDPVQNNGVFQTWKYLNTYSPEVKGAGYRPQDTITVHDGDTVYVGVGNSNWPSSYWGNDAVTESVYTFHISIDETSKEDKEAAEAVEGMIDEIGDVTLDSEDAVLAAYKAYLELTDAQKELVSNYDVLEDALDKLEELKDQADEKDDNIDNIYAATLDRLSKEDAVPGNEWKAIGLARSGKYTEAQTKKLMDSIAENAKNTSNGKLNERRCTENAKAAITAAALGYDPTDIGGVDLLKALEDKDYVSKQGITGFIWSNIAYTSVGKKAPYVNELLALQLDSGAFSFDGKTEDVDLTAMALTSLRGVKGTEDAVFKGFKWLLETVDNENGVNSSESLSQIMIAVYSHDEIEYDGDKPFSTDTIIKKLTDYYIGGGEFAHEKDGSFDGMATEQALLAMTARARFNDQKTALYDFTDTQLKPYSYSSTSESDNKGDNPNTSGGAAFGLMFITAAAAAFAVSKKK
ncbi:protein of unknown function [Ruminococcaceae bacterium FB2012]|nr:protein of unknown function [Ruminococcaceae bacterium FB2012]